MSIFVGIHDFFGLIFHRRFYSEKAIKRYQFKQLNKLLKFAMKNSEFYNELYTDFPINSLEDFHKLPSINKKIMMDNFTKLNTCKIDKEDVLNFAVKKEQDKDYYGYYKDEYVIGLSSGTSGNKGVYITPKAMTKRLPFVFFTRSGLPLRILPYRILFMLRVFSQGFEDINNFLVSLKYLSTMENIDKIIDSINDNKINILMAPPSLIRQILPRYNEIKVKLKRIVTYAEVLDEIERDKIEKTFKTKVIEIYQASEGQMASACSKGHLHINEDLVYVELYDKFNKLITKPGVVGHKMVITNLINYAQPLIRYEMNDMIILDEKCECGSNYRHIDRILGRTDDILYFYKENKEIQYIFPDLFVRWIIVVSDEIREFKIIQNNIGEIDITIDIGNNTSQVDIVNNLELKIQSELELFAIENVVINITVEEIKLPTTMNKYKRFVSNIENK